MIYSQDGLHDETYWELTSQEHTESYRDTVAHTRFLVDDAIKRQMVSDVPVCTFLSGGIDSSIVTAIAANYMNTRGKTLNTFSFDFKDNDRYFKANAFQPERDLPMSIVCLRSMRQPTHISSVMRTLSSRRYLPQSMQRICPA